MNVGVRLLIGSALFFWTPVLLAQSSAEKSFKSTLLAEDVEYTVFLPGDEASDRLPLLIVLHGFRKDHKSNDWLIRRLAERMEEGTFPKTVIVAPNGKKSWYIEDYQAKYPFASMFVNEFLPHLDATYPVSTDRRQRAITGMSMGGFGALRFAMVNPDQFGICISEQAGISTKDQAVADQYYEKFHGGLYGDKLVGEKRVNEHFLNNNPLYIARKVAPESLKRTRWYLQSADDDFHSLPVAELHAAFHRAGVKHEYRVNDGRHGKKNGLGDLEDRLNYLAKWIEEGKVNGESPQANESGIDDG